MVAKFPDLFAAATSLCGISDYAAWYAQDQTGEFRDEMDVWIGCLPEQHKERYAARSGLQLAANVRTPLYMAHGDGDLRFPSVTLVFIAKRCGGWASGSSFGTMNCPGSGNAGILSMHPRPKCRELRWNPNGIDWIISPMS